MKRVFLTLLLTAILGNLMAQKQMTKRQQYFPVATPMVDENIEWQKNIYRVINLLDAENAGLYSPAETTYEQQGLFMRLFELAAEDIIPIYNYNTEGNEVFDNRNRIGISDILTNHHIPYQQIGNKITIERSDIPTQKVMMYYFKEAVYYNLNNSTFHSRVVALCPVILEQEEYTEEKTRYPLFWVKYSDLEPHLRDLTIISNYCNREMVMTMTDYLTLNKYRGSIYKVENPFGNTIRQMVNSDAAAMAVQQQIEDELNYIKKITYNTTLTKEQTKSINTIDTKTNTDTEERKKEPRRNNTFSWLRKIIKR